jgi:7-cyano-7-deazaguanine tRNA-ribosyltransferase
MSQVASTSIWQLSRFPELPHQIMLDSGSYSYIANHMQLPTPREAFTRQIAILGDCDIPATICAVDMPMLDKLLSLTQRNQAIDKTIANAWELKILMAEYYKSITVDKQKRYTIEPLAIIQGYDIATLKYCARNLLDLGYNRLGIGSMAHLYHLKEIVKRVEAVQSIVGNSVHVFGVSAIETLKILKELGVISVDSARPIKAAIYNEILYSEPYQRFGIEGSHFKASDSKFSPYRLISELSIICPCPVCKNGLNDEILKLGTRKHLLLRAIHNYYHIKKMIVD